MSDKFSAARHSMVISQLQPNQIYDTRVIEAMEETPRELFVPKGLRGVAYLDDDLRIADGRWLMEPVVFALLLQAGLPAKDDVALVVGAGRGCEAAVLGRLCSAVVALESDADLAAKGSQTLQDLNIDNVAIVEGNLADGYPKQGPYDLIVINGGVCELPAALLAQLADGGRLLAVVGEEPGAATLVTREGDRFVERYLFDANIPALPEFSRRRGFEF